MRHVRHATLTQHSFIFLCVRSMGLIICASHSDSHVKSASYICNATAVNLLIQSMTHPEDKTLAYLMILNVYKHTIWLILLDNGASGPRLPCTDSFDVKEVIMHSNIEWCSIETRKEWLSRLHWLVLGKQLKQLLNENTVVMVAKFCKYIARYKLRMERFFGWSLDSNGIRVGIWFCLL